MHTDNTYTTQTMHTTSTAHDVSLRSHGSILAWLFTVARASGLATSLDLQPHDLHLTLPLTCRPVIAVRSFYFRAVVTKVVGRWSEHMPCAGVKSEMDIIVHMLKTFWRSPIARLREMGKNNSLPYSTLSQQPPPPPPSPPPPPPLLLPPPPPLSPIPPLLPELPPE